MFIAPCRNADAYGSVYRFALFPAWEALKRRATMARLRHLEKTQWLPREELRRQQMTSLLSLLEHAYAHVPHYRRKFKELGLTPRDIRSLDDVARLPLLTRSDIHQSVVDRNSTAPPFPTIRKTTSGSTGAPITIAYDAGSEHWRQGVKWRSYAWAQLRPGDRIMHYWGTPQIPPSLPKRLKIALDHTLRRERYVDCVAQDDASLARTVEAIRTFKPHVIISYARAGGNLARYINENKARRWNDIPFISTAEQLAAVDRTEIERAFGPGVHDSYGGRETMLLAMECEAHEGLHTSMENILLEIEVTEPDGRRRPAAPGETGEVVVTDLHNFGAPLIRYLNGDLAKAGDDLPCPCGRTLPRIASVEGRRADTLTDGFGERVHGMLFPVLMLNLATMVKQYQVVQHADRSITIRIVPLPRFNDDARAFILDRVERAVRSVPIDLKVVDTISVAPSGKRHPVIVETQ